MIRVQGLACVAGDFRLGEVSFSTEAGECFVIPGPTGAGKTLLLKCIAGLHRNPPGTVWINGQDVSAWMPQERQIGYVPQDYALFPFLSVKENILFPLRVRHKRDREAWSGFQEIVDLLRISHLLDRGAARQDESRLRARLVTAVAHAAARMLYFKLLHSSCKCGVRRRGAPAPWQEEGLVLCEGQEATLVVRQEAIHILG